MNGIPREQQVKDLFNPIDIEKLQQLLHLQIGEEEDYDPTEGVHIEGPQYTATPKSYGPKPLTIEQYRARQRPTRPRNNS